MSALIIYGWPPALREIMKCYAHLVVGTRRLIRLFYKEYAEDQKAPKCAFLSFPERSFFSLFFLFIATIPFRHTWLSADIIYFMYHRMSELGDSLNSN